MIWIEFSTSWAEATEVLSDRVHERAPLCVEVEYRTAGAFLVAFTSNLSKGGLFIETDRPTPIGTELVLRFSIPGVGPIEVRGSVVWIRPDTVDGKRPGMGVEFEQLDQRYGQVIDNIATGFRGLRILVLAVDLQSRLLLVRSVKSMLSAADVFEAESSDAAEPLLEREPDLAVIDIDENDAAQGLYILHRAKTAARRQLPVIALARTEEIRGRARELGADELLPSPPVLPDLQQALLRALGRPLRVG